MYDFNHQPKVWKVKDYTPGSRKQGPSRLHEWGGGRTRCLLFAIYTIALLCLLRFDKVLKIQAHDLEIIAETCIKLTLPFRKTSQFGGQLFLFLSDNCIHKDLMLDIRPFYLHVLPESEAHLCPIRALAEWLSVSGIRTGYIFQKMASGD
jgi:hypothetical protein